MAHGVRVRGSIGIERPVDEVFDFVADQRNEPIYNPDMTASEKLTDEPIGLGTTYRATTVGYGHEPITMAIEVTGYDRPRRIETATRMEKMDLEGGMTFEPFPGGTRMTWNWTLHPKGGLRLLGPLVALMGRRSERRIWTGLKHHLEGR